MLDPNFNPVIRVRDLHNRFGTQVVHDGLDMEVQQHETVLRLQLQQGLKIQPLVLLQVLEAQLQ